MTDNFDMAAPMNGEKSEYNPNRLLDSLLQQLHLKNDAALSRALEVAPPVISKIRHYRLPVGASLLIRMHEVSGLSIRDLRFLMGDRREKYRMSDKQFNPNNGKKDDGASKSSKSDDSMPMDESIDTETTMSSDEHTKVDEPRE